MSEPDAGLAYLQDRYAEEQARFAALEQKGTWLLASVTLFLAVLGALTDWEAWTGVLGSSAVGTLSLLLFALALVTAAIAWGFALGASWPTATPTLPIRRSVLLYMADRVQDEAIKRDDIASAHVDTLGHLTLAINAKADTLRKAHEALAVALVAMAVAVPLGLLTLAMK